MLAGFNFFAYISTLYLILLSFQDIKNKGWVDDRKNYFMMGVAISLLAWTTYPWWYVLVVGVLALSLNFLFRKKKVLGEADVNSITWMFLALGYINMWKLSFFIGTFIVMLLLLMAIKKWIMKKKGPIIFYPALTILWIFNMWFMGLY